MDTCVCVCVLGWGLFLNSFRGLCPHRKSILTDKLNFDKPYWEDVSDEAKDFVKTLLERQGLGSRSLGDELPAYQRMNRHNCEASSGVIASIVIF